jgi:tetratricopeptide (TPR) repeat protein
MVTAAVQLALCTPGSFRTVAAIHAMGALLDQPAATVQEQRSAVGRACSAEDDNALLLCLRSWLAESSDVAEMQQAVDDTLVAWSRTEDPIRRALLAARLAWAQCQVLHRAEPADSVRLLERARAAGDVALDLLLSGLDPNGRPTAREMSLLALATHAKSFSDHVTEERDDLERGVERYRAMIADLERAGLDVSPTSRNNLGYCAMALAGRLTRGPASDLYDEAATQFDQILASFGLLDTRSTASSNDRLAPLRRLAELGPDSTEPRDERLLARPVRLALANRGNLFRLHKQYDAALVCYGAALHLQPNYLEAWAERAWVHAERPRTVDGSDPRADADADVRRMLHADGGNDGQRAKALRSVCWAFSRAGDPAHCERWFDELQRLDPDCRDLAQLQQLASGPSTPGDGVDEEKKVGDVRT